MTTLERVEKMLAIEVRLVEHYEKEITVDFPAVRCELRQECIEDVIKEIKRDFI